MIPRVPTRTPLRVAGLLLALVCVLASPLRADQPQRIKITDLAGFIDEIDTLVDGVDNAADTDAARKIAADLPDAWRVLHDPDDIMVINDWIPDAIQQAEVQHAWPKTRTLIVARLNRVRDQAEYLQDEEEHSGKSLVDLASARSSLNDVLSRGEFKQRQQAGWSDAFRSRLQRWIEQLIDHLPISRGATAAVSKVFAWVVAIGALLALVVYLIRARLPQRSMRSLDLELPRPTSAEWAAKAYAALRAGDAREAMHCGYHAVLYRLEEQGVWRVDESRTPREYVHLLPAQDQRRAAFIDLTRRFEQTWYGSRAADAPGLLNHLEAFGCSAPSKTAI